MFYLNIGQKGHFAFKNPPAHLTYKIYGNSAVTSAMSDRGTRYSYTQGQGSTVIKFSNGVLIYLLDKETAWNFFAVPTTSNPHVKPSQQILAIGPYLIREASIHRDTVSLIGDNANTTKLEYVHPIHMPNRSLLLTSHKSIPRRSKGSQHQMERQSNRDQADSIWKSRRRSSRC